MHRRLLLTAGLTLLPVAMFATFAMFLGPTDGEATIGHIVTVHDVSPQASTEDRFYLVRFPDDENGQPVLRAFYRGAPQGYFGNEVGCTVSWLPDYVFQGDGAVYNGVFRDACRGATFDVYGTRLFGPASGNLIQFRVTQLAGSDDATVDTRVLLCSNRRTICERTR